MRCWGIFRLWFVWLFVFLFLIAVAAWVYIPAMATWNTTFLIGVIAPFSGILLIYLLKNNDYYNTTGVLQESIMKNYESFAFKMFKQHQYLWKLTVPDTILNTFTTKAMTAKTHEEKQTIAKEKLDFDRAVRCHEKTRDFILDFIRSLFLASTTNHHILIDSLFNSTDKPQPGILYIYILNYRRNTQT